MSWNYKVNILSDDVVERFRPLNNYEYECIVKYIMNNDLGGMLEYLDQLVLKLHVTQSIKWNRLNVIDKIFILTVIRCMSILPSIKVNIKGQVEDKTPVEFNVDLFPFLNSINNNYIPPIICEDQQDYVKVTLHYPRIWDESRLESYIHHIVVDDINVDTNTLELEDITKIIDQLSPQIHTEINTAKNKLAKSINSMKFIDTKSRPAVRLNPKELIRYVKLLFTDNLNNLVEFNYVLVKLCNLTLGDIMKLSPVDTRIYYSMYMKELSQREKEAKRSKSK